MKKTIKIGSLLVGLFLIFCYACGSQILPEDSIIKEVFNEVSVSSVPKNREKIHELENLRIGKSVLNTMEAEKYLNNLTELDVETLIVIADKMAKKAAKIGRTFWVEQDIGIILGALLKKYQRGEVTIEATIINPLNDSRLSKDVKNMICELCYEPSNFKKEDVPKVINTLKSLFSTLPDAKKALEQINFHEHH